ncbi:MAG: cysteine synthase family protein [Ruminococcus sp.]|jgi:cysteine synthase A|nr:cysteine synthase family protein [Ruminococcus sp.]
MFRVAEKITELIGETPLVRYTYSEPSAVLLCKLECMNPTGTLKDRVALRFLEEKSPGQVITAATSGALGVSLAAVGAALGLRVILCMPDRGEDTEAENYGAEIRKTEPKRGFKGAVNTAKTIAEETGGFFINQFEEEEAAAAHRDGTGTEIWEQSGGVCDILVCGVGSGAALSGTGELLRRKNPNIKIIAVEPEESAVLSGREAKPHNIKGLGAGFVPKILKRELIDEILTVSFEKAEAAVKSAAVTNGMRIGISSGAVLCAAIEVARRLENKDKTVVAVLPN